MYLGYTNYYKGFFFITVKPVIGSMRKLTPFAEFVKGDNLFMFPIKSSVQYLVLILYETFSSYSNKRLLSETIFCSFLMN